MSFPNDFLWGGAISANQSEGAYDVNGKGSIFTDYSLAGTAKTPRLITFKNKNGEKGKLNHFQSLPEGAQYSVFEDEYYPNQKAIDFYHRYKEDIKLFAEMGFKIFRMSISWSRIFPNGEDEFPNQKGLDFYRDVFLELKKYNIEPLVTLSHYDLPIELETKYGGWKNRILIDLFVKYSEVIMNEYKGLVKYWLTFNEINSSIMIFDFIPNLDQERINDTFIGLHNQFLASAKTVKLAHEIDKENKVGCMVAGLCAYPYTCDPDDVLFNQEKWQNYLYYSSDVMVRGEYPHFAKKMWKEFNVTIDVSEEDAKVLKEGTVDLFTFSYYSSTCNTKKSVEKDGAGNITLGAKNQYLDYTEWGWAMDPKGLRFVLHEIYGRYNIPIIISENGLGKNDVLTSENRVHDEYRISYLREHFKEMEIAIEEGVKLIGYTMWGCIDLIAASTGEMKKRYGLVYVDLDDQGNGSMNRFPKDSFYWYKKVIASNGKILD